jgi:hypothetical protein
MDSMKLSAEYHIQGLMISPTFLPLSAHPFPRISHLPGKSKIKSRPRPFITTVEMRLLFMAVIATVAQAASTAIRAVTSTAIRDATVTHTTTITTSVPTASASIRRQDALLTPQVKAVAPYEPQAGPRTAMGKPRYGIPAKVSRTLPTNSMIEIWPDGKLILILKGKNGAPPRRFSPRSRESIRGRPANSRPLFTRVWEEIV